MAISMKSRLGFVQVWDVRHERVLSLEYFGGEG